MIIDGGCPKCLGFGFFIAVKGLVEGMTPPKAAELVRSLCPFGEALIMRGVASDVLAHHGEGLRPLVDFMERRIQAREAEGLCTPTISGEKAKA